MEYGPGFVQETQAGIGKEDGIRIPFEEPYPYFIFEAKNLAAERRLGNLEPPGGFREVEFFSDSNEVAQVPQFHDDPMLSDGGAEDNT
jgi:hypothetical protein